MRISITITLFLLVVLTACKLGSSSDRNYDVLNPDRIYKLGLGAMQGEMKYRYDISNETVFSVEMEDKNIENITKSDIGVEYTVNKDTADGFKVDILFDKIRLYSKNNNVEADFNAENAGMGSKPEERMLGLLTSTKLQASVNASGDVKSIQGYDSLWQRIVREFRIDDEASQLILEKYWNEKVNKGVITNSLNQLFKVFPDSAIHVGDTWKINSETGGEINLLVKSIYTLEEIEDGIAKISVKASVRSQAPTDNSNNLASAPVPTLEGEQRGQYEVDTKTGMPVKASVKGGLEGTIIIMGRELPVVLETNVKITNTNLKK